MARPSISLVTPSFNQASYLSQTIESVLSQNYPGLEYFIFDGLSSDGSIEIIKRYELQLAGWVSRKDRGQTDAINQGLRQAQGEIVGWINSDDYLCPGALETVGEYFEKHPQVKWLIGACELLEDKNPPHTVRRPPPDLTAAQLLAWWPDHWFCQQATFWRRSLLDEAGYPDESLHYVMDVELWLRFFAICPPAIVPQTLAGYRLHPTAKCITAGNQLVLEELAIHQKILAAKLGEPLALYKTESPQRLIQLCGNLARKEPKPRNFSTGDLLTEFGRRLKGAPRKLLGRQPPPTG